MNPATERRRGGGGHVLRAGPHAHHQSTRSSAGSREKGKEGASKDGNTNMPTVPPRAAVISAASPSPDENHEGGSGGGGVTLAEQRKEKDKDSKEKDVPVLGSGGSGPNTGSIKSKSRERENAAAVAAAAASTREKEKDERIVYLENEMAVMEREFQNELLKLSQNESEMSTFWQSKYSALNQQYLRTDTELRLLRTDAEVREVEREDMRKGWEVLRRELKQREDEIRGLRGQVRGLKEFVSTSTRTDGQTSDEVFLDGMTKLGNGLQNWVIVNFRKSKMGKCFVLR